jgi:hypothetical protein
MKVLVEALLSAFNTSDPVSLLVEYSTSNKTEKSLRELVESASIQLTDIISTDYNNEMFLLDKHSGFIKESSLPSYSNRYYVTILGLSDYLTRKEYDWTTPLIEALESKRLPQLVIRLKKEERLFVFMLLILGATDVDRALKITDDISKKKMYEFLVKIDEKGTIRNSFNDKAITWGQGKKISWTKFITEWVDLPKTGLYFKSSKNGVDSFYLDLTSSSKIKKLKDYLLEEPGITVADKLVLHDYIRSTSNKLILELQLGYLIPPVSDNVLQKLFF